MPKLTTGEMFLHIVCVGLIVAAVDAMLGVPLPGMLTSAIVAMGTRAVFIITFKL